MNAFARPRVLAAAAGLTLTLALSACGGTDTAGTSTAFTASSVSTAASTSTTSTTTSAASGKTASSESVIGSADGSDTAHNDADVLFVQQMIPHHKGAIAMAEQAPRRASDQDVKDLAAHINAAQQPEIDRMNSWLAAWNTGGGTGTGMNMGGSTGAAMGMAPTGGMAMGGMAMGGMAVGGMMSDEDMAALTAVTGADFDRLFLTQMIANHHGAVDMADVEIGSGANSAALALAESIRTGQTAEIATMQELLARI